MSLGLTQPIVGTPLFPGGVTTLIDGSGKRSEETVAMSVSERSPKSVYISKGPLVHKTGLDWGEEPWMGSGPTFAKLL